MKKAFLYGFMSSWVFLFLAIQIGFRLAARDAPTQFIIAGTVYPVIFGVLGGFVAAVCELGRQERQRHPTAPVSKLAATSLIAAFVLPFVGLPLSLLAIWSLSRSKEVIRGRAMAWGALLLSVLFIGAFVAILVALSITLRNPPA